MVAVDLASGGDGGWMWKFFVFCFLCYCLWLWWIWLVAAMVGGCGGCDMGGWIWWPTAWVVIARPRGREDEKK